MIFDETQAPFRIREGPVDLAVLDRSLPREGYRRLLRLCLCGGIPVVALTEEPLRVRLLTGDPLPCGLLPFPFLPEDLTGLCRSVLEKTVSETRITLPEGEMELRSFRLPSGPPVTAGELDILIALAEGRTPGTASREVLIAALNHKLSASGSRTRIRRRAGSYEWGAEDE